MAKSLFMTGREAGYDVHTQQGLDRFVEDLNAGKVPFPEMPALAVARSAAVRDEREEKKRKKKRKAERAARKRNR
jgi:hypothetical protein